MEGLEPANILRNQQVAGSIPAGDSILLILKDLNRPTKWPSEDRAQHIQVLAAALLAQALTIWVQ